MKHLTTYKIFEKRVPKSGRDNIYRDDKYIIVSPLTHNASCKYGAFSDWCISVPGDDYMWDNNTNENRKTIVIILIQRGLQYNKEREDIIQKYKYYYRMVEDGEKLTDSQREEMYDIELTGEWLDLRKIAFIYSKRTNRMEIWTNNNIDITERYYGDSIYNLDIDYYAIDEIMKYIKVNK